jgi:uncharacterized protein YndB with AHSA1/START domain
MNENLRTANGRSVLHMERRLAHPPEKVWRAITEPTHISQWFPADMEMDVRVGGKISFVFRHGEGPTIDGMITEFDPPRFFAYTWGDNELRWELRADGDGCLLIFEQVFDDRYGAASFASGWQVCIDALEALLAGRPVEPPSDTAELHESYVAKLGLADGTVEATDGGWRVRFERQLTRPAETVWATLGEPVVGGPVPATLPGAPGTVTVVEAPRLLAYETGSGGRVRWELTTGTGHGPRLVVTHTGHGDASATLAAWKAQIDALAQRLLNEPSR